MRLALVLLLLIFCRPSVGDILYDTGVVFCEPGSQGCGGVALSGPSSTVNFAWVATRVSFSSQAVINSVSVWMNTFQNIGNTYTVALYPSVDDLPDSDQELFSEQSTVVSTVPSDSYDNQWQTLSGINWMVEPGTYWIALEVRAGQTYDGYLASGFTGMDYGAVNPMPAYAQTVRFGQSQEWLWDQVDMNVAFRIEGTGTVSNVDTGSQADSSQNGGGGSDGLFIALLLVPVVVRKLVSKV